MTGEVAATLEARLERLQAAGAEHVDPASLRLVTVLLSRGAALAGGAEAKLRARAEARLEVLEAAIVAARAAAEAAVQELTRGSEQDGESRASDADLAAALADGDPIAVAREARRRLVARARAEERVSLPWLSRLRAEARARGLALPEEAALEALSVGEGLEVIVTRGAQREAQARGRALSAALFRESASRSRAELAVARAGDNAPAAAGPYNPQVLSARALAEVAELCPGYLRALIAELDDLAGLKAALAPGKAERRAGKGRAASAGSRPRRAPRSVEEPGA